jgi:tape measure domain-containing protein
VSILNLQLNTGSARAELAALNADITAFARNLEGIGKVKGFQSTLDKLSSFKGIEARATQSLNQLAYAMQQASAAASQVANVSKSLNSLARIRVDSIANNLERVSRALAGLRIPPSVARFANDMQRVAQASGLAANGIMRVSRALNTIKAAPGLSSTARSFERIGQSAGSAASGLATFSRAGSTVSSVLSGFGVVLGGVGFARIVQGSYDALRSMEAFKNAITATQGSTEAANKEWDYVVGVASRLRLSIDGVAESYGSFSAAAHLAGVSTDNVHKVFEALSGAARVLNMNSMQVTNAFRALEQMFSKGTVGAEELRQQLGDALPGAMQLMAQAVGVSTGELRKMMQSGEVLASSALPKFADVLIRRYGAAVPQALNSAQAAFDNFGNAMSAASRSFGTGFFDSFKESLNSLAQTMQNPAFVQAAYAWGQALGTAANVALQGVRLVAENFDILKYAVLGVVGLKLGSTIGGWVQSFMGLAAAAGSVTRTVAGVTVTIANMSTLGGVFAMLRSGLTAAAGAAVLFVRGLGPIGLAVTALTVAVPLAIDLFNRWTKSSDQVANASTNAANGANKTADAAMNVGKGANSGASGLSALANQLLGVVPPAEAAADSLNRAASAAVNFVRVGSSAADLASYMRGAGGVSVISTPEEMREYDGYKYGGIAGKPTGLKYRLPASAFINAPRFAGGGLSDGGIPAVLHPNEAVVPLTGGGQIPVANMTTGQGSLLLLKPLNLLVDYTKQVKTEVARVWEATTNQTVITKNALDRIEASLLHIDNTRFSELANILSTGFSNLRGSIDSIRFSSGGGGGSYSSADYASLSYADKLGAQLDKIAANYSYRAANANAWTGNQTGMTMLGGQAVAIGSKKYYEILAQAASARAQLIKARIAAGEYSEADIQKMYENLMRNQKLPFSPYASGSPNAWKDEKGGFAAILHPNEAVIPLPDGRSVPVDMPSSFMDHISRLVSEGDARTADSMRSSGNRVRGEVIVNAPISINIQAKDVDSFNASRDQLMRDLQRQLDRAMRRVGRATDVEDPTKRT